MDSYVLAGLVKRLYSNFNIQEFNYRFKLQKFVFLIRSFGFDFGYSFNLYIHGPYSPDLARDSFQVEDWSKVPLYKFDSTELENKFKKFLDLIKPKKDDENWLEMASTLLLLKDLSPNDSEEALIKKGKTIKNQFDDNYISKVHFDLKEGEFL